MSYTKVRVECSCGWNAEVAGSWLIAAHAKELLAQHYEVCGADKETDHE